MEITIDYEYELKDNYSKDTLEVYLRHISRNLNTDLCPYVTFHKDLPVLSWRLEKEEEWILCKFDENGYGTWEIVETFNRRTKIPERLAFQWINEFSEKVGYGRKH